MSVCIFLLVGKVIVEQKTYYPEEAAKKATQSTQTLGVIQDKQAIIFVSKQKVKRTSILFYQGAFVEEESYSMWARQLAEEGYPVYLIRQPFNMAVLNGNKAESILTKYAIDSYVIGGHSLGGVMASRFAHKEKDERLLGVFFLASYPDEKGSLRNTNLPVLSITGSKDGVLNWDKYKASKKFLPKSTIYQKIQGGNHAGFGRYGLQDGDNTGDITTQAQQEKTYEMLSQWLQNNVESH